MSANPISWRRIRALNHLTGERYVHAIVAYGSLAGHWLCVRHDGTADAVNPKTGERHPVSPALTSRSLLSDRAPRDRLDREFLDLMDSRAREIGDAP